MLLLLGIPVALIAAGYFFDKKIFPKLGMGKPETAVKPNKKPEQPPGQFPWWTLGLLPVLGLAVWFFFFRKKKPEQDNLYYLGLLGKDAPKGMETNRSYLAGCAKRIKEERGADIIKGSNKSMAGMPIQGATVTFGTGGYRARDF